MKRYRSKKRLGCPDDNGPDWQDIPKYQLWLMVIGALILALPFAWYLALGMRLGFGTVVEIAGTSDTYAKGVRGPIYMAVLSFGVPFFGYLIGCYRYLKHGEIVFGE